MEAEPLQGRATGHSQDPGDVHWCRQLAGLGCIGSLDAGEVSRGTMRLMRDGVPPDDWNPVISDLMIHGTPRILRTVLQNLGGRLRRLVLSNFSHFNDKASRRLEGLRLLFDAQRDHPSLVSLVLQGLHFDTDETEVLYQGLKGHASLEQLHLDECDFMGPTWRLFAGVFSCPCLTSLQIGMRRASHWSELVQAFRFAQVGPSPAPLRILELHTCWLPLADAHVLADGLQDLRTITSLHIGNEEHPAMEVPQGWLAVFDALRRIGTLERLEIVGIHMTQPSADALAGLIETLPGLQAITIDHIRTRAPEDVDCGRLALALKRMSKIELERFPAFPLSRRQLLSQLCASPSLVSLTLNEFSLRKGGAVEPMVELIGQNRLRELSLISVGRGQLQAIVDAMRDNPSIEHLTLDCKVDPGFSLHALTVNRCIKNLNLNATDLSGTPLAELAALVCNHPSIEGLDLDMCNLDASAIRAVADALATSRSIRRLDVQGNPGLETELDYLFKSLKSNKSLIELSVGVVRGQDQSGARGPMVLDALAGHAGLQRLDDRHFVKDDAACMAIERLLERNRRAARPEVLNRLHEAMKGFAQLMGGYDDIGERLWKELLAQPVNEHGAPLFDSAASLRAAVALSEVMQGASAAKPGLAAALGAGFALEPVTKRARTEPPR